MDREHEGAIPESNLPTGQGLVVEGGSARVARPGDALSMASDQPIPSMSTDNTAKRTATGGTMSESDSNRVINQIRDGMRVVDRNGEDLGRVDHVRMGDPTAATVDSDPPSPGLLRGWTGEGEPDVEEPLRSRLLLLGYVKIDGKGWLDTDRYVTADLIGRVDNDVVHLAVDKDRLMQEA